VSYPVKLGDLMSRSLQRANLEGANTGDAPFITDAELTNEINSSVAKWWDMLIGSTFAGQIARAQYQFSTVANQSTYALPGDFARQISLDAFIIQAPPYGAWTCTPYNEEQRNQFTLMPVLGWGVLGNPVYYQIQYPSLSLRPIPNGVFTMQLNYFPVAPRLMDREDQLDSIQGWEEYIVLDVAVKLLIKDGQTDLIPLLEGRRQEEISRITAAAKNLDQGQPERMHQTRPLEWEQDGFGIGYGGLGF
jgi:hypothetical protein